ncbi:uncharacterized protein [Diabrotica undecimpunctata]|uniref:uncharacterized protein n=1 Tax=Diabrotica undecimpunctata TaxID=50387 RepID=UPI003B63B8DE
MLDVPIWILGVILLGIMGIIIFSVVMCLDRCGCDEGLQDQTGTQNNVKGTSNDIFNSSLQHASYGYDNKGFSQDNIASTSAIESVHYPQLNASMNSAEPTIIVDNNIEHKATVHSTGDIAETSFSEFVGENGSKSHSGSVGPSGFDFSGYTGAKLNIDDDVFHKNIDKSSVYSTKEIAGTSSQEDYGKNISKDYSDSGGYSGVRFDTGSKNAEILGSDDEVSGLEIGWNLDQPSGSSFKHHLKPNEAMHFEHNYVNDDVGYEKGVNVSNEIAETSFSDVVLRDLNTYSETPTIQPIPHQSSNSEHDSSDVGHKGSTNSSKQIVETSPSAVGAANILTSRCESGEIISFSLNDVSLNLREFNHNRDTDSRQLASEKAADLSTNERVKADTVSVNINYPMENTSIELLPTNNQQLLEHKGADFDGDRHEAVQTKTVSSDINNAVYNSDTDLVHTDDKQLDVNNRTYSGGDEHKAGEINSVSADIDSTIL